MKQIAISAAVAAVVNGTKIHQEASPDVYGPNGKDY